MQFIVTTIETNVSVASIRNVAQWTERDAPYGVVKVVGSIPTVPVAG